MFTHTNFSQNYASIICQGLEGEERGEGEEEGVRDGGERREGKRGREGDGEGGREGRVRGGREEEGKICRTVQLASFSYYFV